MKIGYDGKRAVMNNTGLGNYSRLLVDVLSKRYPENDYVLYTPVMQANKRLEPLLERPNVYLSAPDTKLGTAVSSIWRVSGIAAQLERDKIQLMHGLSGELPLNLGSGIASVVTIHDLIFRRCPANYHAARSTTTNFATPAATPRAS